MEEYVHHPEELVMNTPEREDILREQALEQIIQQIKKEFEEQKKPLPSQAALRKMAKDRHDKKQFLT